MRHNNPLFKRITNHVVLSVITFIMLYPLLWMLASSFKPEGLIFSNPNLFPTKWTLRHYIDGFSSGEAGLSFGPMFLHSFELSVVVVIGTLFSSTLTGFAFARLKFPLRRFLFAFMLGTMMLPAQVVLIPQYILFHKVGLVNTFFPLMLPSFFGTVPFFIFLMVQFIRGIPNDLDEAAYIDGCSTFRLFRSVILPLTQPALIVISIFAFYWTWNDFFGQLIYLSNPHLFTASLGLSMFLANLGQSEWGNLFAMSILSVIPVFIVFLIFQRYLVEGIATQGRKG